jgi:hypothetical protein
MAELCGYAASSENGTKNGAKGDQTGKEVKTAPYYNFGQNKLIRFKDASKGALAAQAMQALCANDNVGYGQSDRITLYSECQRIGWDINRIGEIRLCNCDCSEIAACVINFAFGREVIPASAYTGNIVALCIQTGLFDIIPNVSESTLHIGDMPIKEGSHMIMALQNADSSTPSITVSNIVNHASDEWVARLQALIGAKVDGRAGTETLGKCPNLTINLNVNEVVRLLQERLGNFYHIGVGNYDGKYGDMTNAGVLELRNQKGLPKTSGDMDQSVWSVILKDTTGEML